MFGVTMAKNKRIKITLVRSTIGQKAPKVATVRSLGLKTKFHGGT